MCVALSVVNFQSWLQILDIVIVFLYKGYPWLIPTHHTRIPHFCSCLETSVVQNQLRERLVERSDWQGFGIVQNEWDMLCWSVCAFFEYLNFFWAITNLCDLQFWDFPTLIFPNHCDYTRRGWIPFQPGLWLHGDAGYFTMCYIAACYQLKFWSAFPKSRALDANSFA